MTQALGIEFTAAGVVGTSLDIVEEKEDQE
jgi:hypothetical protein